MRPREHLIEISKKYPNAWKMAEDMRADRGKDLPFWPDWCYLPIAGAYAIVSAHWHVDRITDIEQITDVSKIGALAPWRITQGIYRFDSDLFRELIDTPVTGNLPHDVLLMLPEWCVYIETPNLTWLGNKLHGYFTHLEYDAKDTHKELRLLLDTDLGLFPAVLHLGEWSLEESITRTIESAMENKQYRIPWAEELQWTVEIATEMRQSLEPLISLLLYLCSTNADIGDGINRPHNPTPKKTRRGPRLFPADRPTTWEVGVRIGAAIRRATSVQIKETRGTGRPHASPRPHIRRAHWHSYWVGPRDSANRKIILHWLSPILVGAQQDNTPVVIHPIKGTIDTKN